MGILWAKWESMAPEDRLKYPLCTAERHKGSGIRADYIVAIVSPHLRAEGFDTEELVYGICEDCLSYIAADLGTTPQAGAHL